ncbi:hypothetical protein [Amaricoccus solimangrovi]|uniref:Spore coat protein U domain-containing protein n=1 Tax=Amaricoccus solimangrovi TaxID=2589815 RepID=A0A501WUZ0_9RHOB|nr:hypothetical protein [Amaricoccus solimangrovi]TPE49686.1 hypothetical protein FJM51_13660 [Amaricoccus solimangrovi]
MIEERAARGLALCLLLGACATAPATPPPPGVQGQPRAEVVMPPARGVTNLAVRVQGVAGEIAGATCDLASPYTTARFTAPASVALPDLGSATPPVTVTCASGKLRGSARAQPATRVADTGMSGWPAIGISVGTGSGGWSGTGVSVGGFWNGGSGDGSWTKVVYPDLLVTLR